MMAHQRLIEALAPLGWSESGLSAAELTAVGEELEAVALELAETLQEASPLTAQGWGLDWAEEYLARRPNAPTLKRRRESLMALLRIGGGSATVAGINATLSGCGLVAQARETGVPGQVEVYFPEVPGEPDGFSAMKAIIESILPSHLQVLYYFWKIQWAQVEAMFSTWAEVEAMGFDFDGLEKYVILEDAE